MLKNLLLSIAGAAYNLYLSTLTMLGNKDTNKNSRKIIYVGGYAYMAVGKAGYPAVIRSKDGVNWESFDVSTTVSGVGLCIAHNGTTFVVTTNSGCVFWSDDLITWTQVSTAIIPSGSSIQRVVWNGVLFGLGAGLKFYTSSNGKTWVQTGTLPYEISALVWTDRWVAGSYSTTSLLISTDHITWTQFATGWAYGVLDLTYANGTVMVVQPAGNVYSGPTHNTLSKRVTNSTASLLGISYANGVWFANSNDSMTTLLRSNDNGLTWTTLTIPDIGDYTFTTGYINGMYFGAANLVSLDGTTWFTKNISTTARVRNMIYANGKYIFGYTAARAGAVGILYSTDAVNWKIARKAVLDSSTDGIGYGNGVFMTVSGTSNTVEISTDGVIWNQKTSIPINPQACFYFAGRWVVSGGGKIVTSTDNGTTWTEVLSAPSFVFYRLIHSPLLGKLFAVGAGTVYSSPDGLNWSPVAGIGGAGVILSGAEGNGLFALASQSGTIWYTSNGTTWNSTTLGTTDPKQSMIVVGDLFYISTSTGKIIRTSFFTEYQTSLPLGTGPHYLILGATNGVDKIVGVRVGSSIVPEIFTLTK